MSASSLVDEDWLYNLFGNEPQSPAAETATTLVACPEDAKAAVDLHVEDLAPQSTSAEILVECFPLPGDERTHLTTERELRPLPTSINRDIQRRQSFRIPRAILYSQTIRYVIVATVSFFSGQAVRQEVRHNHISEADKQTLVHSNVSMQYPESDETLHPNPSQFHDTDAWPSTEIDRDTVRSFIAAANHDDAASTSSNPHLPSLLDQLGRPAKFGTPGQPSFAYTELMRVLLANPEVPSTPAPESLPNTEN